jgi:hypothetical protein
MRNAGYLAELTVHRERSSHRCREGMLEALALDAKERAGFQGLSSARLLIQRAALCSLKLNLV